MQKHLTEEEFTQVRTRLSSGQASICIPRRVSRQFFTHTNNSSIRNTTASSVLWQKGLVWMGVTAAPILLLVCGLVVINNSGWWAAVTVPAIGIFWTILAGLTAEDGDWPSITIALGIAVACDFLLSPTYSVPLLLFVFSMWIHRMTYILAQVLLTRLVSDSFPAWEMLTDYIKLNDSPISE